MLQYAFPLLLVAVFLSPKLTAGEESVPPPQRIRIRLVDADSVPVPGATVVLYDGNRFWAGQPVRFKQKSGKSNDLGEITFADLPDHEYRIQVQNAPNGLPGTCIHASEWTTFEKNPLIQESKDHETLVLTICLRHGIDLKFAPVDIDKNEEITSVSLYFRDARVADWSPLAIIDAGGQHNFTTLIEEMYQANFLAVADGYYPLEFILDDPVSLSGANVQPVRMTPAPRIRLTVVDRGKPVANAPVKGEPPKWHRHQTPIRLGSTSELGQMTMAWPQFGADSPVVVEHAGMMKRFTVKDIPQTSFLDASGRPTEEIVVRIKF